MKFLFSIGICLLMISCGFETSGEESGSTKGAKKKNQIELLETELGGLIVGNFDFRYDGVNPKIEVRVVFDFEEGIDSDNQANFKERFFAAIKNYWQESKYVLEKEEGVSRKQTRFIFDVYETKDNPHKVIKVEQGNFRANVTTRMRVPLSTSERTLAHEFGHVLGLYDEYDGGFMENIMFWHSDPKFQKDKAALMNIGDELRPRYFEHYIKVLEQYAKEGVAYSIVESE